MFNQLTNGQNHSNSGIATAAINTDNGKPNHKKSPKWYPKSLRTMAHSPRCSYIPNLGRTRFGAFSHGSFGQHALRHGLVQLNVLEHRSSERRHLKPRHPRLSIDFEVNPIDQHW